MNTVPWSTVTTVSLYSETYRFSLLPYISGFVNSATLTDVYYCTVRTESDRQANNGFFLNRQSLLLKIRPQILLKKDCTCLTRLFW
jgi:hypothetical protein